MNHLNLLKKLRACGDATEFAATQPDMETAWANCQRPDWMIWLLRETGYKDDRNYRLFACRCIRETRLQDGRTVWDLLKDPRSRKAVEVAEKYAVGEATAEELVEARKSAYAAYAYAADAVYVAAANAAYAAYAVRKEARSQQADILREMFPWENISKHLAAF